jgi:hypothetical protein
LKYARRLREFNWKVYSIKKDWKAGILEIRMDEWKKEKFAFFEKVYGKQPE